MCIANDTDFYCLFAHEGELTVGVQRNRTHSESKEKILLLFYCKAKSNDVYKHVPFDDLYFVTTDRSFADYKDYQNTLALAYYRPRGDPTFNLSQHTTVADNKLSVMGRKYPFLKDCAGKNLQAILLSQ